MFYDNDERPRRGRHVPIDILLSRQNRNRTHPHQQHRPRRMHANASPPPSRGFPPAGPEAAALLDFALAIESVIGLSLR